MEELKRRLSSGTAAKKQLYDSHTKLQARYSAAQDQACSVNDQLQEEVTLLKILKVLSLAIPASQEI